VGPAQGCQRQTRAILEVNNDTTERRQAEEEVIRINEQLEQRVEERTSELVAANREMEPSRIPSPTTCAPHCATLTPSPAFSTTILPPPPGRAQRFLEIFAAAAGT